ncbi:phage terminase large subunit [Kozakia baliensis]|uniref:DNA packaging protein n=1 Tax=Kozakia baliensis TaxID=153496 RepID=A0A1D8UVP5_9PROT|nr:phage terminase large subunit [Kozakia baliensis]AOX17723.1 DNA packaging protein [Kozakia baliensis]GEL62762.1 DNA-packaging protein [Kozakia baliensis]
MRPYDNVFALTKAQQSANRVLGGQARHIFLRGGSRSGKTFVLLRALVVRALKEPGSRHGVFRYRLTALKATILRDTFPKVMRLCFPNVFYRLERQESIVSFTNGSSIFFGGLDDAQRTEKILGLEFATIYLNEASQISYGARNMLLTRLAQRCGLVTKEYIDANPPMMDHWLYALFEAGIEPKSGEEISDRSLYATLILNPESNRNNLSLDYLSQLEALPERERRRFLLGEFQTVVEGALWRLESFRRAAVVTHETRPAVAAGMRRIIVAVDPSGASGPEDMRSDEIGIVVCGVDWTGVGHVLDDCSVRDGPVGWANRALRAFDEWGAERIVAERNFGGALVEAMLRSVRPQAAVKMVNAARGKAARAEPVAALYDLGRVTHHGRFSALEDQLCHFSVHGYRGAKSPDRADAMVWGLSELMLSVPAMARWEAVPGIGLSR